MRILSVEMTLNLNVSVRPRRRDVAARVYGRGDGVSVRPVIWRSF